MQEPTSGRICGVLVTYNIGEKVSNCLEAALPQLAHLVVVDNSTEPATMSALKRLQARHGSKLHLLSNSENNLAKAQNMGIQYALDNGFDWVLLLDHDSIPAADMLQQMLNAHACYPNPSAIGLVAPHLKCGNSRATRYIQPWLGLLFRHRSFAPGEETLDNVYTVIASGSLIPSRVFTDTGLMDEAYGIDYVDKDFCLRLHAADYRILVVRSAILQHRIGDSREHSMLGRRIIATHHSAQRRYTIYRNRSRSWRRYIGSAPGFVLFDAMAALYDLLRIIFLEEEKGAKLKAALRGLREGILGLSFYGRAHRLGATN